MTNREYLSTMSDKKLAEFHHMYDCPPDYCDVTCDHDCTQTTCVKCWAEWFSKPYTNVDADGKTTINGGNK